MSSSGINWSRKEKLSFLKALEKHGHSDVNKLFDEVPSRSRDEIQEAVTYYEGKANFILADCKADRFVCKGKNRARMGDDEVPLVAWTKALTTSLGLEKLQTEVAMALRYIAEFEQHPHPDEVCGVKMKILYLYIANLLDGRLPPPLNYESWRVLQKTLFEAAIKSKRLLKCDFVKFLQSLNRVFPEPLNHNYSSVHTEELYILRKLITCKAYNPLNIPEDLMINITGV